MFKVRRALVSVSDKRGLIPFVQGLAARQRGDHRYIPLFLQALHDAAQLVVGDRRRRRAVERPCGVLVVDEPMVGLDPRSARVVKDVLKQRSREGMTIFLSTHILHVAEELADRIGILNAGRLIAVGSMDELRERSGMVGALEYQASSPSACC